jgi:uncharacterized membrane protein
MTGDISYLSFEDLKVCVSVLTQAPLSPSVFALTRLKRGMSILGHAPHNPPSFADWMISKPSGCGRNWGDVRRTGRQKPFAPKVTYTPSEDKTCFFTERLYNSGIMDLVKRHVQSPKITWKWGLFLVVFLLLFGWLLNTPVGILGKADAIGYAVCHQIDSRSFHLLGRQMPLCARCTGMYLGAMLGLVFQFVTARRRTGLPPWRVIIILGLLVIAFGIDGINSYLHFFPGFQGLYEPQNWLRLLTGTGMGIGVAALLFPAFNQSAWKDWDEQRALSGFRSLGVLLVLAVLMDLVVLTEFWPALYFFALVSAAGALVMLVMVYTMLFLMVLRKENLAERFSQISVYLIAGFFIALLQIAALDLVRYWLTGTWSGFNLG